MNNIIKRVWNQNRMVNIEDLSGMAFQAESGGHTFEISGVNDAGETVALSGSVAGVFIRPDLADIAIVGEATDGVVSVTLPADCYAVNGRFALTIFVTSDSQKVAVYAAVGTVTRTSGGAVAGDTPQDVVDLINAIDTAVQSIPADYSDLMAAVAPTYSNTSLYAVGSYAWYDGVLYRCTTAITTAESWTAAHWNVSAIGNDVAGIKQELENAIGVVNITLTSGVYISLNYDIGDVVSLTPSTGHVGWNCACVDCEPEDVFTLNGKGGNTPRLYGFLDSTNHLLQKADNSATASNLIIKAPDSAAKLVVNLSGTNVYALKGKIVDAKIADINSMLDRTVVLSIVDDASGVTENNKLYNALSNAEVSYTGAQYCYQNNLTPGQYICISGYVYSNASKYPLYAFYDNNNTLIQSYGEADTKYSNIIVKIPQGATKVYVNGSMSVGNAVIKGVNQYPVNEYFAKNTWYGKRIGILGTSVAFGANASTSYAYEASKLLGFELSMFGVPGLAIEQNTDGTPKTSGSFSCSIAQYEAAGWTIPDDPVTPYVPGGSYNNYYRTYENVFVEDNADIDLWVYAVIPNNTNFALDDWNAFNKNEWKYNDNSAFSEHCKTFIGALLFVMDQMYRLNPNARMVFAVDSLFSYSTGLPALQTVASQWNIPIINLWGKINTSPKSMEKIKSINGTNSHPSTFAHEIMGKMFAGELGLVN